MAKREIKEYENISIKAENLTEKIDFYEIFGRNAPVHVEIGSGKGTFILNEARENPDIDFLGIEWAGKYYRHAVDRIGRWGLQNVRIIRTDAAFFIARNLTDSSVDWFDIYFPDPWPKKRHHKRRLLSSENAEQLLRCLKPGGVINIATDHADYFQQITKVIDAKVAAGTAERIEFTRAAGAEQGEIVGTNYERKYIVEGRKTYTAAIKKI
jgi:tRNA (guanine-N7-)-methyltransferase